MWAEVQHLSIAEKYESDSDRAMKTAKIKIQYCTDITEKDRIEHDNQVWKILGITELGRRELTELFCEYVEGMSQ